MVFAKGVAPAPKAVRHPMTVLPLRVGAGPLILLGSSAEAATGFRAMEWKNVEPATLGCC
jgi:hypothetical protein